MHAGAVHHCRVNVNGPREAADALVDELSAAGARPVDERCLVMTSANGTDLWEELSSRHPLAVIGLECFEEFGDDFLQAHIENGRMTVMARHGVLPEDWSDFYEDEGERLSEELVRGAAVEVLAAQKCLGLPC